MNQKIAKGLAFGLAFTLAANAAPACRWLADGGYAAYRAVRYDVPEHRARVAAVEDRVDLREESFTTLAKIAMTLSEKADRLEMRVRQLEAAAEATEEVGIVPPLYTKN